MNRIEAISTADESWATLVPAIRVASTEKEDLNEAHELSKRQSETGGSQKRKGLGILVERSSAGRSNPAKTHRHWNAGRLANRVCRPIRSRCHPLRDQPTNPSTSHQKHQFRDACKSLSPTRVAGHFQQDQADARSGGRGSQIVFDAGDLRGLVKEMDSPTMACMSIEGHQGDRRGEMAQESLFSENWCSASAGQQGEDQKHHECTLFSCDQVGVDREESNHECSPERTTAESTRRSDSGRNHGIPQGIARSTPDDDRIGCFHWAAPRRTDRASVARRGFRESCLAHSSICGGNGGRCAENGGFSERRSAGRANGRIALGMETAFSVPRSGRLGICLSAHERPTTLLAGDAVAVLRQAGFATCQGDEASLVSHISAHFWDVVERERRVSKGCAGTVAPCESQSHDRRLHTGSRSAEARGAGEFGQTDSERRGFGDQAGLSGSNWIMKKRGDFAEALYFVGVPDGI